LFSFVALFVIVATFIIWDTNIKINPEIWAISFAILMGIFVIVLIALVIRDSK